MSSLLSISRPAALACGAALLALAASPLAQAQAQAQAQGKTGGAVTYPASLERADLLAWMKRDTDIAPESVVAISPLAIIAIMQTQPITTPQGYEVTVRAEIIDPTFVRDEHLLSWHATIKLACRDRTVSVGEATGHGERNLLGEGHPVQVTATGWRPVVPDSMQGQIWSARCDRSFVGPLADDPAASAAPIATSPEVPRRPAPAPVAPPPAPAAIAPTARPTPPPVAATPLRMTPQPEATPARPPRATPQAAPVAAARSAAPTPAGVNGSVQILASPVAAEAQHALAALRAKLPEAMAGLRTEVVPVQTGTVVRHRAIVSGFRAPGDATRFCRQLTAAGGTCFVRGDAGRAPSEHAPQP